MWYFTFQIITHEELKSVFLKPVTEEYLLPRTVQIWFEIISIVYMKVI